MDLLINRTDKIWLEKFSAPNEQGYISRLGMRYGAEVVADLKYEMRDLLDDCEWSSAGLDFLYQVFPTVIDGTPCTVQLGAIPSNVQGIACYAQAGQNEGDYAHVKLLLNESRSCALFTAKTFNGNDHAWQIARMAASLLDA